MLFALGVGEEVVATSSYSLHPKEAQKLPIIGGYESPNIEKILALAPTLVVGQTYNAKALEQLKGFNVKTLALELKSVQSIQDSLTKLSQTLHKKEQGKKLNENINQAIKEASKNKKPHSVMIVYGLREDISSRVFIAGKNIFFNDIIELSANVNAFSDESVAQPVLNYENIIALNPDQVIILRSRATEPNVYVEKALSNWYALPINASKNKRVSVVDEDYLHIPSHRVALTIRRLSREMND
jgi:iron complex transport system substrate-binding protein